MAHSWNGRRVLVTGGTGFIGSFLVERLLDLGARVRVPLRAGHEGFLAGRSDVEWVEADLRGDCGPLVDGIDEVFHLASVRKNVDVHQKQASDVANENVRMTLSLIEALHDRRGVPVTFVSTGNLPQAFDIVAAATAERVDGYVLGKAICETLWLTAAKQRGFPLLIARPVGVYGPRDAFTDDGNVIPALMVRARAAEDALHVWGDGTQQRSFLYVTDVVTALLTLIDAGAHGVQYVASPRIVTVRELAETIRDLVHPGLPIVFDADKPTGAKTMPAYPVHPSLASMEWTPFERGLEQARDAWLAA